MLFRQLATTARTALLALALACSLTGCIGGPIAQQVASSLLMRAADKATSDAYDSYLIKGPSGSIPSSNTAAVIPGHSSAHTAAIAQQPQLDEYWAAFLNAGFTEIKPTEEPLPETTSASTHSPSQSNTIATSELVAVETWNLLLGEEKQVILEQARLRGNDLPPMQEWSSWQVAVGASRTTPQSPVTFLVPPDLGRIGSGQELLVEISLQGDLNIARYRMQSNRALAQAAGQPSSSSQP